MPATLDLGQLIASGRIVDWILGLMALEAVVLLIHRARTGRGLALLDVFLALAPGACLLLALRVALTGRPWVWVALALAASLPFHLLDLVRRGRATRA